MFGMINLTNDGQNFVGWYEVSAERRAYLFRDAVQACEASTASLLNKGRMFRVPKLLLPSRNQLFDLAQWSVLQQSCIQILGKNEVVLSTILSQISFSIGCVTGSRQTKGSIHNQKS